MRMRIKMCFLTAFITISFVICSSAVFAVDTSFISMAASSSTVKAGESFSLTVSGADIKDLYAYEVNLIFDDELLGFKNIVSNIQGYAVLAPTDGNQIKFASVKMKNQLPENGDVSFCTLTFTAKKSGIAVVRLESIELMDEILTSKVYSVGKTVEVSIVTESDSPTQSPSPIPASTPVATPIPAFEPELQQAITVIAIPGTDGIEAAIVTTEDFQAAINKGIEGIITVRVQSSEAANAIRVEIPAPAMAALEDGMAVKTYTDLAVVSIAADFLKSITTTDSVHVELSIFKVDKAALPEEVRTVIGDNAVYDFNINVDGKKINSFGGSNVVEVEISYLLAPEEDPDNVIIYFIDDSGELVIVKNGIYNPATGKVKFRPLHFSKYTAVYEVETFTDIGNVPWARVGIDALAARGIVNGVGGGDFNPERNVTRAEFVKMLIEAFDLVDENAESSLSDVRKESWYYNSVASAEKLGIVMGKEDGSFGVNEKASREDMVVLAYRTSVLINAKLDGTEAEKFLDSTDISSYAVEAVEALQNAGIINGVGDRRFAPRDGASRAEAAVVIHRLFSLYWN